MLNGSYSRALHADTRRRSPRGGLPSPFYQEIPMKFLLALPFIGLLWVPFYNSPFPMLFGFPFYYWYQFAWVPLTSLLIWIVYRHNAKNGEA
jgi:hypothetical protein